MNRSPRRRSSLLQLVALGFIALGLGAITLIARDFIVPRRLAGPVPTATPATALSATTVSRPTDAATDNAAIAVGQMRIVAPKVDISTAITQLYFSPQGDSWDLTYLDNMAGHLQGTADLGQGGNFVLAGHVELGDGRKGPFVNLSKLNAGDEIMIIDEDPTKPSVVRYKVTEIKTVAPDDISVLRNRGYEELTLITCDDWDQAAGEYLTRIIVHARPY